MPSPNPGQIVIKCKEDERDEVKRLAQLQGLTIQRYALKRLLKPYEDKDLENVGFGLVMRKLREKGYPDTYIKKMCGELLRLVVDAPEWSEEYDKFMDYQRKKIWEEDIEKERELYGE